MILDFSFWSKFIQESELLADQNICLQYSMALADRFSSIEEFLSADEKELISLGLTDATDRANLVKQARSIDEVPRRNYPESWLSAHQSTPLNPKTFCNLSLGLVSRISFNDHPTGSGGDCAINPFVENLPTGSFDHLTRTPENQSKCVSPLDSSQKKTPLLSLRGMRTNKSLSDTISLQKKIPMGTERLKRLSMTKNFFKRPTAIFRKQINNLKKKLFNPFGKLKISSETPLIAKNRPTIEIVERGKLQILNVNQNLDERFSSENVDVRRVVSLGSRKFKLGAPTTFVTRALANHSQLE